MDTHPRRQFIIIFFLQIQKLFYYKKKMRGGYTKSTRLASYFKIIRFNYRALPDEYIFICLHIIRGRRVCVCVDIFKIGESSAVNNTQHTIERQKNVFFYLLNQIFDGKNRFFLSKNQIFF